MNDFPGVNEIKRFILVLVGPAEDWLITLAAKQIHIIALLIGGGALVTENSIRNSLNRARAGEPPGREGVLLLLGLYKKIAGLIYKAKGLLAIVLGQVVADRIFEPLCKAVEHLLKYIGKIADTFPKYIDKVIGQNPGAGQGNSVGGTRTPSSAHTGMNNVRGQASTVSQSPNPNPWVKSM